MTNQEILCHIDHTLLKPTATWAQIEELCRQAIEYKTASVCIPPCYIAQARAAFPQLCLCTVIGFPLGYNTTACKVFEAKEAVEQGADEIDMVINRGWVKEGNYRMVTEEIAAVRAAAKGKILKVIVETCDLTEEELKELCRCVSKAGADFIKTSTGFGAAGATYEAVKIMAENVAPGVRIKAAGGIRTREEMETYLALGCDRLGTSAATRLMEQ